MKTAKDASISCIKDCFDQANVHYETYNAMALEYEAKAMHASKHPDIFSVHEISMYRLMAENARGLQGTYKSIMSRCLFHSGKDTVEKTDIEPKVVNDVFTYTSTQATNCAVCGEHKHTPLRNDQMGGYVCLTCINRELNKLQTAANPPDSN